MDYIATKLEYDAMMAAIEPFQGRLKRDTYPSAYLAAFNAMLAFSDDKHLCAMKAIVFLLSQ